VRACGIMGLTEEFMNDEPGPMNDEPDRDSASAQGARAPRLRTFAQPKDQNDPQRERLARITDMGPGQLEEEMLNFHKSSASRLKLSMDKTLAAKRCAFTR
jgi:hypothetical protein